jgi:pimeloyl-ACP methyl ester carboxylesterase
MYKVAVGEAILEYSMGGSGEPVVLLPTAGCSISYFAPFARVLADAAFQTIAINLRGVGESTGPLDGMTLHDLAADVAGVIEALGCAPVHVLGHAFGNRVARCLAADRPDLIRTVVLLAAGGQSAPPPDLKPLPALLRPDMTAAERAVVLGPRWLSPASDPNILLPLECWPMMHTAHLAASNAIPLEDWWTAGTAPLLVVQGLDDRGAPPSNGHALRAQLGERVQLVDIPQAGHFLILERPQAIAEAVLAFLRAH